MDKISTRFLTYSDIAINSSDLIEDVFFSRSDTTSIKTVLQMMEREPSPEVVKRILDKA